MISKKNIIIYSSRKIKVDKIEIKSLIADVLNLLSLELERIQLNIIDDDKILNINKTYLKHDYFTDIITFDYSENNNVDCELFISYDSAFLNSKKYRVSFNSELMRLIIHGILHVAGFDDQTKEKKIVMKRKENQFVKKFNKKYYVIKNEY